MPKIGDLGKSKNTLFSKKTTNNIGIFTYWAPELCESNNIQGENDYDFKVDVWAFGILALELLLRKNVFTFVNPTDIPAKIKDFPS